MNEAKSSRRRGKTATGKNSEAQPVTIGYRLGFEAVYKTQAIAQLAISSAVCTRIPGLSRCFKPSSANVACIPGTPRHAQIVHACALGSIKRGSHLHLGTPRQACIAPMAISQRCQSQTTPACPAQGRAGCLPAYPSYEQGPRRPQPRGWSPRCRNAFPRTACPPR